MNRALRGHVSTAPLTDTTELGWAVLQSLMTSGFLDPSVCLFLGAHCACSTHGLSSHHGSIESRGAVLESIPPLDPRRAERRLNLGKDLNGDRFRPCLDGRWGDDAWKPSSTRFIPSLTVGVVGDGGGVIGGVNNDVTNNGLLAVL